MSPPTPKFKSKEFRAALDGLKGIFDARALAVVLGEALERRAAEQICARMKAPPGAPKGRAAAGPTRGGRLKDKKRAELVERIVEVFFTDDEVAFQTMKELDRSCQKERHLAASLPEDQASERMGSYRALALARERARMTWALARDGREAVRAVAGEIITRTLDDAAQLESAKAMVDGRAEVSPESVELAQKLQEQAGALTQAAERVSSLESKISKYEEERARLLAQMGSKERLLRQESQARENLDEQLGRMKAQLTELEGREAQAQQAIEREAEARATAERLEQKVRRLTKLADASKSLSAAHDELGRLQTALEDAERRAQTAEAEGAEGRAGRERELARARAENEELREELKTARRRIVDLERRVPFEEDTAGPAPETLAVLLDQANLAATAAMAHRRKVNFAALLDRLSVGRKRKKAVAFVVDNGGTHFDAFCETLRRTGWELRVKKPKQFQDGTSKADWDMGIAVEAVELRGSVETIALVSGDGDFAPLVKLLKRWGMRVEVASFAEGLALDLQNAADAVTVLGSESLE